MENNQRANIGNTYEMCTATDRSTKPSEFTNFGAAVSGGALTAGLAALRLYVIGQGFPLAIPAAFTGGEAIVLLTFAPEFLAVAGVGLILYGEYTAIAHTLSKMNTFAKMLNPNVPYNRFELLDPLVFSLDSIRAKNVEYLNKYQPVSGIGGRNVNRMVMEQESQRDRSLDTGLDKSNPLPHDNQSNSLDHPEESMQGGGTMESNSSQGDKIPHGAASHGGAPD